MQGVRAGEPVGPDVWETCRELIPAGSVFAFLAEHREALFPAGMFADMYPSPNGRPSLPPQVLAATVVLQALHGMSDFETVQVLRCDLRWKAACGLGLLDTAFDPSLLTYFRRRLARSADPNRLFFRVRQVVAATGVLAGKNRRALDSVVLDDAVATQDTVTQLIAAVRRVTREVPGAAEVAGRWCTAHDYADPGKPKIAWDDEAARAALVDALVTDALSLLRHLPRQRLSEQAANAVGLLALVAGQDVEPAGGSDGRDGRWRIAKRTAKDRVISTVDPTRGTSTRAAPATRTASRGQLAARPTGQVRAPLRPGQAAGQARPAWAGLAHPALAAWSSSLMPRSASTSLRATSRDDAHTSLRNCRSSSSPSGLARYSRRVPSRRSVSRPAFFSTVRCWLTAVLLTSNAAAISPAGSSASATSRRMARRRGSAMALSASSVACSSLIAASCGSVLIAVAQLHSPTWFPSGSVKMANRPKSPGRSVGGTSRRPPSCSARSR